MCELRWEWEVPVPELGTSVFLIPAPHVKNREERLVVLNAVAESILGECRGIHPQYVFTFRGHRVGKMNNTAWKQARKRAGLPHVRVHDLKRSVGGYGPRACPGRLGRCCWVTRVGTSPPIIQRQRLPSCWKPRTACAAANPAKLRH